MGPAARRRCRARARTGILFGPWRARSPHPCPHAGPALARAVEAERTLREITSEQARQRDPAAVRSSRPRGRAPGPGRRGDLRATTGRRAAHGASTTGSEISSIRPTSRTSRWRWADGLTAAPWPSAGCTMREDLIDAFPRVPESDHFFEVSGFRSLLAAPIASATELYGALEVYATREHAFDEADAALLEAFAAQAAIAFENARLIAELEKARGEAARRADEERTLREISGRVTAIVDPVEVLQAIVHERAAARLGRGRDLPEPVAGRPVRLQRAGHGAGSRGRRRPGRPPVRRPAGPLGPGAGRRRPGGNRRLPCRRDLHPRPGVRRAGRPRRPALGSGGAHPRRPTNAGLAPGGERSSRRLRPARAGAAGRAGEPGRLGHRDGAAGGRPGRLACRARQAGRGGAEPAGDRRPGLGIARRRRRGRPRHRGGDPPGRWRPRAGRCLRAGHRPVAGVYTSDAVQPAAERWPDSAGARSDQGLSGQAYTRGATIWTGDYLADDGFPHGEDADTYVRNVGIRSGISAPLVGEGGPFGAITVLAARPDAFGPQEADLLEAIAAQVAISLANARLIDDLDRSRAELASSVERERTLREIGGRLAAVGQRELLRRIVGEARASSGRWLPSTARRVHDAAPLGSRRRSHRGRRPPLLREGGLDGRASPAAPAPRGAVRTGDYLARPSIRPGTGSTASSRRPVRSVQSTPIRLRPPPGHLSCWPHRSTPSRGRRGLLDAFAAQASIAIMTAGAAGPRPATRRTPGGPDGEACARSRAGSAAPRPGEIVQLTVDEAARLLGPTGPASTSPREGLAQRRQLGEIVTTRTSPRLRRQRVETRRHLGQPSSWAGARDRRLPGGPLLRAAPEQDEGIRAWASIPWLPRRSGLEGPIGALTRPLAGPARFDLDATAPWRRWPPDRRRAPERRPHRAVHRVECACGTSWRPRPT